jgi:hypothetical protein
MTEHKIKSLLLRAARWDKAKALEEGSPATLLQLSILLVLAVVGLIACMIWLSPTN